MKSTASMFSKTKTPATKNRNWRSYYYLLIKTGATGRSWNQRKRAPQASRRDPEGVQGLVRFAEIAGGIRQLHVAAHAVLTFMA